MNFAPNQPAADDVTAHMPRVGRGMTTADVEGHGIRGPEALDTQTATEDDVEGHMPRIRTGLDAEAPTEDDVDGHGYRRGGFDTQAPTEDDVEGHGRWTP